MRFAFGALGLLALCGCASLHERTGDVLLSQGDKQGAYTEYGEELNKRPIMDWEYERLRDKRLRIIEGEWSPIVTDAIAVANAQSLERALETLVNVRQRARKASATIPLMERLDGAIIARLSHDASWPKPAQMNAYERTLERLALHEKLRDAAASEKQLEFTARRVREAIEVGFGPSPGGASGRLSSVLNLRETLRNDGFPVEVDALLDREFAALRVEDLSPDRSTPRSALIDAVLLQRKTRELGAGPQAVAVADAMTKDALTRVIAAAKDFADKGDFYSATELLGTFSRDLEPGELHQRLAEYAKAGREQSMQRASSLGVTGRAYLEYSRAVAMGGGLSERNTLRDRLGVATGLSFKPEVNASEACAEIAKDVSGSYPQDGVPGRLTITVSRCATGSSQSAQQRSAPYQRLVTTYEEKQVQVGTRYERVAVGSHKVQCTQESSLPGMQWQGLCDVTDYETKAFPVYETQRFPVTTEQTLSFSYSVQVHRVEASVAASARLVTDEGVVLTADVDRRMENSAETFSYTLPGKTEDAPGTPHVQTLSSDFSPRLPLMSASSSVRSELWGKLKALLVEHRAKVMREKAKKAMAEGRTDDATDAHVMATLIDGKLEDDAAAHLSKLVSRDSGTVKSLLSQEGLSVMGQPSDVKWPDAKLYAAGALKRVDDGWERRAAELSRDVAPTQDTYHEGIFPPNEFFDVHGGIVPGEIQLGDNIGGRVGVMAALDGHYSPLEYLGLRYFFALHDELGIRFTLGMSTAKAREYENGGTESPLSVSIDAHYALYAGLRLPWFSIMAGARVGIMHAAVGEVNAGGFHFEPAARIALRLFEIKQLVLEASGLFGIPGVPHKNRFALSFPILGKDGIDLSFTVEQTMLNASDLDANGTSRSSLGLKPVNQAGVQIGARL
ncbi:MAG: hypothetical protein QM817_41600 [Archangium sp.]